MQDMELRGGCGYLLENNCGLKLMMSTLYPKLLAVPTCRLNQAQKRKKNLISLDYRSHLLCVTTVFEINAICSLIHLGLAQTHTQINL